MEIIITKNEFSPETIYIAGHIGLVRQAFVREFQSDGDSALLLRKHAELDLTNQGEKSNFFSA